MLDKVLLIDDDEITLMICEIVIKNEAFAREVLKTTNGEAGIGLLEELKQNEKEKAPELILLDLNMPVMNGWEFMKEYTEKHADAFPNTSICILTSSVDPMDLTNSRIYEPVIGFINKPLTSERLEELKENEALAHFFTSS